MDYLDKGDVGAISLDAVDQAAAYKVFGEEPCEECNEQLAQREARTRPSPRITIHERAKHPPKPREEVRGKEGFLRMLQEKFGSIIRAWRRVLDANGDGQLSREEFFSGCRAVGYT